MIKLIIAGGRDFTDYELLKHEVKKFIIEEIKTKKDLNIISGTARGADKLGERFANEYNFTVILFPANWGDFGKRAGRLRNEQMAKFAQNQYCIVFWDGESRGTKHMIEMAESYNLKLRIVKYGNSN